MCSTATSTCTHACHRTRPGLGFLLGVAGEGAARRLFTKTTFDHWHQRELQFIALVFLCGSDVTVSISKLWINMLFTLRLKMYTVFCGQEVIKTEMLHCIENFILLKLVISTFTSSWMKEKQEHVIEQKQCNRFAFWNTLLDFGTYLCLQFFYPVIKPSQVVLTFPGKAKSLLSFSHGQPIGWTILCFCSLMQKMGSSSLFLRLSLVAYF